MAYSNVVVSYTGRIIGGKSYIDAFGLFYREKSWMIENKGSKMLRHEQCHFDITELYSRKFEQAINEYQSKHEHIEFAEVQKIFEEIVVLCNKAQQDYGDACYSDGVELLFLEKLHKELEASK